MRQVDTSKGVRPVGSRARHDATSRSRTPTIVELVTDATRNDELAAGLIAVASGVLAAFAGASPTGSTAVDIVLVAVTVGLVTWLAAGTRPVLAGGTALVAGALSGSPWFAVVGVGAYGAAVWIGHGWRYRRALSAGLALVTMNIAVRGSLDLFLGAETAVAVVLALVLVAGGLRSRGLRTRRVIAGAVAAYAVAAIVGTAATAWAGARAIDDLRAAEAAVDGALDLVIAGDTESAQRSLDAAMTRLSSFESSMGSPLTTGAAIVPVVAQHRSAALEVSRSANAAMASITSDLDAFDIETITAGPGAIDLDAVRALERPMLEFQDALRDVIAKVDDVRSPWLVDRVAERLDELELTVEEQVHRGDSSLDILRAAPGLLGADEPRTYFLAFTTPSEVRGLGGFMGFYAELTADDGRIEMSRFGRTEVLARTLEASGERSVITGPEGWLNRYSRFGFAGPSSPPGTPVGTWLNVTMSPDARATSEVIAQLYPYSGGRTIDGVFTIDVIAVARLLDITGPVVTSDGVTLDSDNAAEFLLNGQYGSRDRPERADLLEEVSEAVIDELLGGTLPSPRAAMDALGPMVEQGRLVGWAADSDEQALFETAGLGGRWPDSAEGDAVAVAFNNAAANKLDYFLRARAHYDAVVDQATSRLTGTVVVEVENRPPGGPQPDYVDEQRDRTAAGLQPDVGVDLHPCAPHEPDRRRANGGVGCRDRGRILRRVDVRHDGTRRHPVDRGHARRLGRTHGRGVSADALVAADREGDAGDRQRRVASPRRRDLRGDRRIARRSIERARPPLRRG
jgi:hypothetical protein